MFLPRPPRDRFGSVRFGSVRCGAVRCGAVRSCQVRSGQVRSGPVRSGPVQSGQVRFVALGRSGVTRRQTSGSVIRRRRESIQIPGSVGGTDGSDAGAGRRRRKLVVSDQFSYALTTTFLRRRRFRPALPRSSLES